MDSLQYSYLQLAMRLEEDAEMLRSLARNWLAYDLDYCAATLRKDAGVPNAFDSFNHRYHIKNETSTEVVSV